MLSRTSIIVAFIALALCHSGCITYTSTSTGDFDFRDRFDKATKEIVERSIQAEMATLKGQHASLDPKTMEFIRRHFVKANELVLGHMLRVKRALGTGSFGNFFDGYSTRRSTLLDFTLKLQPSLDIVESKIANATAFPSGKILINRPLAEAFDANRDGFDSVLLGILIHELIHVRDGHALEQWATSDSRQAWAKDKVMGTLSSLTALIPFLTIKYDKQYPLSFGSAKQLPTLSEYAADLGAVSILEQTGLDSKRYITFLTEMGANLSKTASKTGTGLLQKRIECLGYFSKDQFSDNIQGIVIGSHDAGDTVVQSLDLTVSYKLASLLDSPETLAKDFPGKPEMSHEERRSLLLNGVRKATFTGCAIRNSFPEIAVKDGVLVTPTFDLAMVAQHF